MVGNDVHHTFSVWPKNNK